jgi:small conductance mechanosensitive channel
MLIVPASFKNSLSICFFSIFLFTSMSSYSTEESSTAYQAITANDVNVDIDELEFALLPLTKAELEVEVEAWLALLKDKATIVAEAEILVSQRQKNILAAQEISEMSAESAELLKISKNDKQAAAKLKKELAELREVAKDLAKKEARAAVEQATHDTKNLALFAEKAEAYGEKLQKRRALLINNLTLLRSARTDTLERFVVVVKSWESKGGDGKELHLYANAFSGTSVDLSDSDAAWLTIKGWLMSQDGGLRWLANIIKFLVALFVVYLVSSLVGKITDKALSHNQNLSKLLKKFIQVSVRRIILIIGFIVSLTFIEINVGPVLALIGAAGLVVGLALQSTLSNFASGMLILIYRPFDVGDIIEIDGVVGTVDSMTLLSTAIKTFDNQHLVVPNNNIWGTTIINVTGSRTRRVDLVFGIGYADDMEKAENIMKQILEDHELVLENPKSTIKVNELGDSSVNFICRPWVKTENYLDVYWDVTRQVKEAFDKEGVSIPFPQRDVHIHQS